MEYQEAREYLARVLPWNEGEWINIHHLFQKEGQARPFVGGRAVKSITDAVKAIDWAAKQAGTTGIYACMSNQHLAEEKISPKGFKFHIAKRNRADAVTLKSLFLDVDVKDHETLPKAAAALGKFIVDSAMPPPTMIVTTGGGLHVYWIMSEPLDVAEWQPMALALAEATRQHKFKCDTQCTVDAVRILRVPNTFNVKYGDRREVKLARKLDYDYPVRVLKTALQPYMDSYTPTVSERALVGMLPRRGAAITGPDDLAGGVQVNTAPPANIDALKAECLFVAQALTDGGKDLLNPLWNMTTLIASFCEDGAAHAHAMAQGHPGYTTESTNELYTRKVNERTERDIGWPKCATIQSHGCALCATCRHRSEGKSPLNFGFTKSAPTTVPGAATVKAGGGATGVVALPPRYTLNPNDLILKTVTDANGNVETFEVMPLPVRNVWVQENPWILNFDTSVYAGSKQRVHVPFEAVAAKDAFTKLLGKQGVLVNENHIKLFREFLMAWMQQLQQTRDAVVQSAPFGWSVGQNGRVDGFTYGGRVWGVNTDRPAANPDPVMGYQYTPRGAMQPWSDAAVLITDQGRPALDVILASAFAAPLVRCTGQSGLLLSAYSTESGIGKTTVLKVAQAVWGDPQKAVQQLDDTVNSAMRKIGELKAIPVYWDELKTEEDTKKFVNLAFKMSSGKERSRLNMDLAQRDPGSWQTMLISTSNDSILDTVVRQTKTNTAGLYRIFEYEVERGVSGQIQPGDAARMIARLNDNFGMAGLEYAKFLGANFERIDLEVATCMNDLNTETIANTDERFWIALIATLIKGAEYANELGFTQIDIASMREFLLTVLGRMRGERNSQPVDLKNALNVSDVLARFLGAMRARHMLKTSRIHISRGKPAAGDVKILTDISKLDAIIVQVGADDKLMRISSTYFSEWLTEHGYSRHLFVQAMKEEFDVKVVHGRLGSGTEVAGMTQYLLEINLAGTKVKDLFDET